MVRSFKKKANQGSINVKTCAIAAKEVKDDHLSVKKAANECVTSELRKNGFREREREKGVEKDGAWKDGQTLVTLFFVRLGIWVNVS